MYVCNVGTFSDDKVETKRRAGTIYDDRETNDKRNLSYTLSTMNNIFHDKVEVILDIRFSGQRVLAPIIVQTINMSGVILKRN